jgi:hypothetical protein
MGYIKEPVGINFVVESKHWKEVEKEVMRKIIAVTKNKRNRQANITYLRRASAKV